MGLSKVVNVATPGDMSAALAAHAADATLHSSGQEIDYLEDVTTTKLTVGATFTSTGLSIVVPASSRPAWLIAGAIFDITTAPTAGSVGTGFLQLKNSAGTIKAGGIACFEASSGVNGLISGYTFYRVPPGAGDTYTLGALRGGDSAFRVDLVNANTIGEQGRTFLTGNWR